MSVIVYTPSNLYDFLFAVEHKRYFKELFLFIQQKSVGSISAKRICIPQKMGLIQHEVE